MLLTASLVQYCELTALAAVEQAVTHEINTAKLLAVEKLLWGHKPRKPGEGKRGKYHHSITSVHADSAICGILHTDDLLCRAQQSGASKDHPQVVGCWRSIHKT